MATKDLSNQSAGAIISRNELRSVGASNLFKSRPLVTRYRRIGQYVFHFQNCLHLFARDNSTIRGSGRANDVDDAIKLRRKIGE